MMKRILKEPLFHFLVGGVLLFAAHAWLNRAVSDGPKTVRITAAEVNWLKETWALQWQRQPNEQDRGSRASVIRWASRSADRMTLTDSVQFSALLWNCLPARLVQMHISSFRSSGLSLGPEFSTPPKTFHRHQSLTY